MEEELKYQDIDIEDKEEDLVQRINQRSEECSAWQKEKWKSIKDNIKLFDGDHWEVADVKLPQYKSDVVVNKIFSTIRSLVGYETDSRPVPAVYAGRKENPEQAKKANTQAFLLQDLLQSGWDFREGTIKLSAVLFNRYLEDDAFVMPFWNFEIDDWDFERIPHRNLKISPNAANIEDAEYIIIEKWKNKRWIKENYPKIELKDLEYFSQDEKGKDDQPKDKTEGRKFMAKIEYYIEDDFWIVKCGKKILERKENPYYEFRSEEEQKQEWIEKYASEEGFIPIHNHFIKSRKPIVQFKGYYLDDGVYSHSVMKQVKKLTYNLNHRKAQVEDNAAMANGQWVVDPSVPDAVVRKITSKPNLVIRIAPDLVRKEPGRPLPEFVMADMNHTERCIDDMFGHHEVSRGVSERSKTLGESQLLKESDLTPVRLLERNTEVALSELFSWFVQLSKLFYTEPHYIRKLGISDTEIYQSLIATDIEDGIEVIIKPGSLTPSPKTQKKNEAMMLAQAGKLSLLDLYEILEYPSPEKMVQRLFNEAQGIIGDEPPPQLPAKQMLPSAANLPPK